MADGKPPGAIRRAWRGLFSPSARWSVFALVVIGLVIGAFGVIATQVAVHLTGTDEFCGTACHSHAQFVFPEHQQSIHYNNRTGVRAMCHDCHIPHDYPALLFYKAKAGAKDVWGEMTGVISTEEKFKKERPRMAKEVWAEYKENNSERCRTCHNFTKEVVAKQDEAKRGMHEQFLAGQATCIDCHQGIAHSTP